MGLGKGKAIRCIAALGALCAGTAGLPAHAYEFATHAALTREAFLLSRLNPGTWFAPGNPELLIRLGLLERHDSLDYYYVDMASGDQDVRHARPVDNARFGDEKIARANLLSPDRPELPSIPAWLMLGAIREDDVPFGAGEDDNTPQDEPSGPFVRVLHHFYDPYHNRPLSILMRCLRKER